MASFDAAAAALLAARQARMVARGQQRLLRQHGVALVRGDVDDVQFVRDAHDLGPSVKVRFYENEGRSFVIAKVNKTPVAAISLQKCRTMADIQGAYTVPRYREHSLFQRLIDSCLLELRAEGFRTVTVQANSQWVVRHRCPFIPCMCDIVTAIAPVSHVVVFMVLLLQFHDCNALGFCLIEVTATGAQRMTYDLRVTNDRNVARQIRPLVHYLALRVWYFAVLGSTWYFAVPGKRAFLVIPRV